MSTQAIRLVLGLVPLMESVRARTKGADVIYLDRASVEHATGLDHRTIQRVLPEVDRRIGLVAMVEPGRKHTLVAGKPVGHASGWSFVEPVEIDAPDLGLLDLDGALALIDPADECWGKGRHAAWRLAAVVIARHGIVRLGSLTYAQAAEYLGTSRQAAGLAIKTLRAVLPIGEDFDLALARQIGEAWSDTRRPSDMRAYVARKTWIDERLVARGDEPLTRPEPTRQASDPVDDDPEAENRLRILRDKVRGVTGTPAEVNSRA